MRVRRVSIALVLVLVLDVPLVTRSAEPAGLTVTQLSTPGLEKRADVPLVILSPRETRVLANQVKFVWTGGPETGTYSVRVLGPNGFQWTIQDARPGVVYPDSAPKLVPGVRYRWEVRLGDTRSERAHFEIVPDREWERIRTQLSAMTASGGPTTLTLARVSLLFQERLYQSALEELQTAIAENGAEPNLRFMLGHVYDRMGLREQAATAFDVGQKLSTD